jgi:hypothetical protein
VTAPNHVRSLTELFSPESSSPPPKVNREHQLVYPLMARAIRIGGKRTPQSRIPVPPVVHFSNDPNTEPTGTANNAARRQLLNHSDDPETRHATSRRQHATPRRNFAIPAGQRIEAARPKTKTRRLESPPHPPRQPRSERRKRSGSNSNRARGRRKRRVRRKRRTCPCRCRGRSPRQSSFNPASAARGGADEGPPPQLPPGGRRRGQPARLKSHDGVGSSGLGRCWC